MSASARFKPSDGDWICGDSQCGNVNFARRTECNKCGQVRKDGTLFKKGGVEIGKNMAEKSKGLFSADDWQCKGCGNVNWARRMTCNMCNQPKYGRNEARTGYGGGYMERDEVVEYKTREHTDSDDAEIDDYGRRKKKFRGSETKTEPTKKLMEKDEKEDEDDNDDVDASKYKLESDEDDDDVDLSKYNLTDSDSEKDDKQKDTKPVSSSADKRDSSSQSSSSSSNSGSSDSRSRSRSTSRERKCKDHHNDSPRSRSRSRSRSPSREYKQDVDKYRSRRRSRSRS